MLHIAPLLHRGATVGNRWTTPQPPRYGVRGREAPQEARVTSLLLSGRLTTHLIKGRILSWTDSAGDNCIYRKT